MTQDRFAPPANARPLWLVTLADLALLLVGFFVLLQATRNANPAAIAQGIRTGFGAPASDAVAVPMPLERAAVFGFAVSSDGLPETAVLDWTRAAARDPRVTVRLTGATSGDADRDPATGSADLLALDRARAVAVALVRGGAVRPDQIMLAPAATGSRSVTLQVGFAGKRQEAAGRQRPAGNPS